MFTEAGEYPIIIIRKPVRRVRMRVMADGTVRVTAPRGFDVSEFIAANKDWIASRHTEMDHVVGADIAAPDQMLVSGTWYTVQTGDRCHINHADQIITAFDPLSLRQHLTDEFRALINASITARAEEMEVSFGRCAIRMQKTRWGSCSSAGNLNMNLKVYALPPHLMDYIVVHELAHRKVLNHSRAFWSEVALHYPAYKSAEKDLRRYWIIIERNRWWNAIQNAKGGK